MRYYNREEEEEEEDEEDDDLDDDDDELDFDEDIALSEKLFKDEMKKRSDVNNVKFSE